MISSEITIHATHTTATCILSACCLTLGFSGWIFEPITILYGGNGSGKSTVLNVISQKLHVSRKSTYNSGELMDNYVELCSYETDLRWTRFPLSCWRTMIFAVCKQQNPPKIAVRKQQIHIFAENSTQWIHYLQDKTGFWT